MAGDKQQNSFLDTTFPVDVPEMKELRFNKDEFLAFLHSIKGDDISANAAASHTLALRPRPNGDEKDTNEAAEATESTSPFMEGLLADKAVAPSFDEHDNKMQTENADVAFRSTKSPLVDLFYELESAVKPDRLRELLEKAWTEDAEATLKIIWNARSIHLGKSDRYTFYNAVGWLYENHPATLIANLPWLVRPIIPKKAPKPEEKKHSPATKTDDEDFDMVDMDETDELPGQPEAKKRKIEEDPALSEFDIKYGVAHGYWKDLLNMLALAANDELKVTGDPRKILNVEKPQEKPYKRKWTEGQKKQVNINRHQKAVKKLENDAVYKALHVMVARLFADQLKLDLARLNSGTKQDVKAITLAGKWAPTHKGMHDQHTYIVSSIAELLYKFNDVCPQIDPGDRTLYLKYARQRYFFTMPKLRKQLQIVERPITADRFDEIKYARVPSVAMKQYTPLFIKKDHDRFDKYIEDVASGKASISGATLLPSTLVSAVLDGKLMGSGTTGPVDKLVDQKIKDIEAKSIGGQWSTLVQRIKDSGTLESSIAVADVSGSMDSPLFPDKTRPIHSAVGLALLIAEVTKPPFGGSFITFSDQPQVMKVRDGSFKEKVEYIAKSNWSMSTNFVSVFEDLILPMAVNNKVKPEDMVKQVFVFSDMQFNAAENHHDKWTTSYERIQEKFKQVGYEMPKLIFWNLAGGRAGYPGMAGDATAPKPVTAAEENTALVSGYSQGQLKMFLDKGLFEDVEEEEIKETEDGEQVVVEKVKKKQDPLVVVKKAISHDAYRMLKVVD